MGCTVWCRMRWGHCLQTAFTSLARWFVKTNTLPIFSGRLHLLHTWRFPSIFNDSGNTEDGSSVIWWNPWFLPSVQVINLPLQELLALHGCFPCPCVHIFTLKRFAKNVFRTWGSSQGPLSGTQTNRPGEHTAPFLLSPSHLQTSPYLWCVLNTAKGLWVVCSCSLYGPGEEAAASHTAAAGMGIWVLGGGAGVLSFMHLVSLTKNCLKQQTRPTHEDALISFKHTYFLGWYVEVVFLPLLWNNLQWGRASCAGRRFHFAKEKKDKTVVSASLVSRQFSPAYKLW